MIFQVTRTSLWDDDIPPCDEAFKIKLTLLDIRTFRSPEEHDRKCAKHTGSWLSMGTNHRYDSDGHIMRDLGEVEKWGVEINSLDELMEFQKKYCRLILQISHIDSTTPCIEIYDDYRE